MEKYEIASVSEYLKSLQGIITTSINSRLAVFRGQKDYSWPLIPSIARLSFDQDDIFTKYPNNPDDRSVERRLIALIRDYGAPHFPSWVWQGSKEEVKWKQILVAQHYRLPTRLLDWTTNPLVALYFATNGDIVRCAESDCEYCNKKKEHNSAVFVMKDRDTFSVSSLSKKNSRPPLYHHGNSPGFLRPPEIDSRIAAQSSVFSLMKKPHEAITPEIKVLIPSSQRKIILREIDGLGVNARTLMPGLEGIADYLIWNVNFWSTFEKD